ncbi:MAG TPA: DUF2934 domain-containing protein [Kofleriaceae bacterium]|nr:DUF2934 domain-containing protein [Kofleriaceae bacterium]
MPKTTKTTTTKTAASKTAPRRSRKTAPKVSAPRIARAKAVPAVTRDDIARRAHELFVERGHVHGHDRDDWFRAEAELNA